MLATSELCHQRNSEHIPFVGRMIMQLADPACV
jgi:hypothetical protein